MEKSILSSLPEFLNVWHETINWQPTPEQQSKFEQLYRLILEGNSQLNLTRITTPEEFWEKHLWDSIRGIVPIISGEIALGKDIQQYKNNYQNNESKIIDVGTGAGFPGLPAAIINDNFTVTLVDSTYKKINFINDILPSLELDNAQTLLGRIEEIGQNTQHRENYDIAILRAVATGSACAEYALPLIKKGGIAVVYRGNWTQEEHINLENTLKILGGKIESVEKFTTPLSKSIRHCLYLRKVAPTPNKYPRSVGLPTRRPII